MGDITLAELLTKLVGYGGPTGVVLAFAYMYIRTLHKDLRAVEKARVDDSKAVVDKLLELNDRWNETLSAQIEVTESLKQYLADIKTMIHDQGNKH